MRWDKGIFVFFFRARARITGMKKSSGSADRAALARYCGIWVLLAKKGNAVSEQTDNFFIHVGGMASLFSLMRAGKLSATAFVVGAALCTFADREGICWPKREDICERTGITRIPTISSALAELTEARFIASSKGQRSNQYRLHLPSPYITIEPAVTETVTAEMLCRNEKCYDRTSAVTESVTTEKSCRNGFRTPAVTETVTSLTYDQSNNETNKETTKEKAAAKLKKSDSPEIAGAAERIVALYAAFVKPKNLDKSGSRKIFLSTATRLLAAGQSETALSQSIRNYAIAVAKTERGSDDVKFRYGFQTFFGPKNEHWRDHLDADADSRPLTLPVRNPVEMLDPSAEYEMPQADVDLIIAWEKEQARKAAVNV